MEISYILGRFARATVARDGGIAPTSHDRDPEQREPSALVGAIRGRFNYLRHCRRHIVSKHATGIILENWLIRTWNCAFHVLFRQ
jgi:hypothetical protein